MLGLLTKHFRYGCNTFFQRMHRYLLSLSLQLMQFVLIFPFGMLCRYPSSGYHVAGAQRVPYRLIFHTNPSFCNPPPKQMYGRHLMLKSADDKTILMHATSSGDSMVLKMVSDACKHAIRPQEVCTVCFACGTCRPVRLSRCSVVACHT